MNNAHLRSYLDNVNHSVNQIIEIHTVSHKQYIEAFSRHSSDFLTNLAQHSQSSGNVARTTHQFITGTLTWAERLESSLAEISAGTLWETFDRVASDSLDVYPETRTYEIPESFWRSTREDRFAVRLRKFLIRLRFTAQEYVLALVNIYLRITGKHPKEKRKTIRTVHTRNLLDSSIAIPVRSFVLESWQSYLQLIAVHYHHLHELTDHIKNRVLETLTAPDVPLNNTIVDELRDRATHVTTEALDELIALRGYFNDTLSQLLKNQADEFMQMNEVAGTFMLPSKKYGTESANKNRARQAQRYDSARKAWDRHLSCEYEEWQKDLDLAIIQFEAVTMHHDLTELINTRVEEAIIPLINICSQNIQQVHDRIIRQFGADHTMIPEQVLKESRGLAQKLRFEYIPGILDTVNTENLPGIVQNYHDSVINSAMRLRDSYKIFVNRDFSHIPPRSEIEKVPFRDLINEDVLVSFTASHGEMTDDIKDRLETVIINAADVDQILDINIEAALSLAIEQDGKTNEDAYQVLRDGIDRSQMHIENMTALFREIETVATESLSTITHDLTGSIQETADNEKVLDLKIRLTRTRTRQKIRQYRGKMWHHFLSIIPVAVLYMRKALTSIHNIYKRARKISRLEPVSGHIDDKIAQYLSETSQKIATLPYVYKRLFNLDPIADRRFFAGQETELEKLAGTYSQWIDDRKTTVAIIGERGSGKTSFLNMAQSDCFGGHPVIRINMDNSIRNESLLVKILAAEFDKNGAGTLDALENEFATPTDHYICMLENIHLLFSRTITGFDLLERLMLFMQNTRASIFWIMSSSLYAWQYLDKAISLSTHFQKILYLKTQSHEQMSTIIMKRHRMSGYRVVYETPPELQRNRHFKKLRKDKDRQTFIEQELFKDLANISAGNIRVAMLFWLTAIKQIDRDQLVISTKIEFNPAFIYQLPDDELFTLAAFIQHEIMDVNQHALIFNQERMHSSLLLNSLFTRGLLQHQPNGYYVHPFLYRPVVEALRSKQMLQ